jgi:hypothetical protein
LSLSEETLRDAMFYCGGMPQGGSMREGLMARVNAFLQEFPFVKPHIRPEGQDTRPRVQRVDLDLMDEVGIVDYFYSQHGASVMFFLFDGDGNLLKVAEQDTVVQKEEKGWRRIFGPSREEIRGESVLHAIASLSDPGAVCFILKVHDRYPKSELMHNWGQIIILYKIPSGWNMRDWIAHMDEVARHEILEELYKVDTV